VKSRVDGGQREVNVGTNHRIFLEKEEVSQKKDTLPEVISNEFGEVGQKNSENCERERKLVKRELGRALYFSLGHLRNKEYTRKKKGKK